MEIQDVRNTHSRHLRLRAFLKGARAPKQVADTYITWQSRGNRAAHADKITCEEELTILFNRLFDDQHAFNIRSFGRPDPWVRERSGVYYLKSEDEA